eukprot:IDg3504t1
MFTSRRDAAFSCRSFTVLFCIVLLAVAHDPTLALLAVHIDIKICEAAAHYERSTISMRAAIPSAALSDASSAAISAAPFIQDTWDLARARISFTNLAHEPILR